MRVWHCVDRCEVRDELDMRESTTQLDYAGADISVINVFSLTRRYGQPCVYDLTDVDRRGGLRNALFIL